MSALFAVNLQQNWNKTYENRLESTHPSGLANVWMVWWKIETLGCVGMHAAQRSMCGIAAQQRLWDDYCSAAHTAQYIGASKARPILVNLTMQAALPTTAKRYWLWYSYTARICLPVYCEIDFHMNTLIKRHLALLYLELGNCAQHNSTILSQDWMDGCGGCKVSKVLAALMGYIDGCHVHVSRRCSMWIVISMVARLLLDGTCMNRLMW